MLVFRRVLRGECLRQASDPTEKAGLLGVRTVPGEHHPLELPLNSTLYHL